MRHFDVFNGDADGICALHQLRLAHPVESVLVTGPKRDIALLERVDARAGDMVTVLDISMMVNHDALARLLDRGACVEYFDHHVPGEMPRSDRLHTTIDIAPDVCTSILVDRHLGGRYRIWAAVGAFGDNLAAKARNLLSPMGLHTSQIASLQALGESLNYNSYGSSETDLFIRPDVLYTMLHRYSDPFRFMEAESIFHAISEGRQSDMNMACGVRPDHAMTGGRIYILPDAAWSRRVRGAFGNRLAGEFPHQAIAVLSPDNLGGYVVSMRTPLEAPRNAQQFCGRFPTGGGRVGAAGINHLPGNRMREFIHRFELTFRG